MIMTSDSKDSQKPYRPTTSELLQEQLPHNSYYYPGFWGSYKGYVKGALGGVAIGGILGALIGFGALGIAALAVPAASLSIASIVLPMTVLGMMKGYHEFSSIGSSAGTGVALDEYEVRQNRSLNKKLEMLYGKMGQLVGKEDAVNADIATHPFSTADSNHQNDLRETPHQDAATHKTTKLFHWRVALIGLGIGLAAGALLAFGAPAFAGLVFHTEVFHGITTLAGLMAAPEALGMASAITAAAGLFGASFAIDRSFFRKIFDFTDRLFYGEIGYKQSPEGPAHSVEQEKVQAPAQAQTVAAESAKEGVKAEQPSAAPAEKAPSPQDPHAHEERVVVVRHTETIVTRKKHGNWKDFTEAQKVLSDLDPNTSIRH